MYNLKEIISGLSDSCERVLFLSNKDTFEGNKKVYTFKSNKDMDWCVGVEVSAIFIDTSYSTLYNLNTLHYLITRIRGNESKKFPDKIYFVSDWDDPENFTFFGDVNV